MVSVIVLGSLGDLVKKIAELELSERAPSRDTTIQMAAYYAVLDQWPVTDKVQAELLISKFKRQLATHIAIEASMQEQITKVKGRIGSEEWVAHTAILNSITVRYLDSKTQLKQSLVLLNSLGKHIGNPPLMLELSNEESDNVV